MRVKNTGSHVNYCERKLREDLLVIKLSSHLQKLTLFDAKTCHETALLQVSSSSLLFSRTRKKKECYGTIYRL